MDSTTLSPILFILSFLFCPCRISSHTHSPYPPEFFPSLNQTFKNGILIGRSYRQGCEFGKNRASFLTSGFFFILSINGFSLGTFFFQISCLVGFLWFTYLFTLSLAGGFILSAGGGGEKGGVDSLNINRHSLPLASSAMCLQNMNSIHKSTFLSKPVTGLGIAI
ncbi:hypothetical protein DFH27DRAFT_574272 [Peziza echinospora]|nr:hypothetical protein DFH27DRAFT_574272 [Peziza echinospora]